MPPTCTRAQSYVEYALLLALIAIFVLLMVAAFGTQMREWFMSLVGRITTT
jgi:Flp pilus assembly pilin Flp